MNYLIKPPSPESFIRSLRREFRARMLGAGLLAGGFAVAPFLFACSCPQRHVNYAHSITQETLMAAAQLEDEDEACALMCGGPVFACRQAGLVPGEASSTTRAHYHRDRQDQGQEPPPPATDIIVCEVVETISCGMGRPPEGLRRRPGQEHSTVGMYASQAAHMEAASAIAFVQLATELEAHGAPSSLVCAAERSAIDEVRHARAAADLARSLGARVERPTVSVPLPRALHEVLRENAVTGVVEEGLGAWILRRQSKVAGHEGVRRFASTVAADEARHAALAMDIEAWGGSRLTPAERRRQTEAKERAWSDQLARLEAAQDNRRILGLPSADESAAWITGHQAASA